MVQSAPDMLPTWLGDGTVPKDSLGYLLRPEVNLSSRLSIFTLLIFISRMLKSGTIFLLINAVFVLQISGTEYHKGPRQGFIENRGQIIDQHYKANSSVLFLLTTPGMNVQLRRGGFSYDVYSIENANRKDQNPKRPFKTQKSADTGYVTPFADSGADATQLLYKFHRIDFDLAGSDIGCEIVTSGPSGDYLNYYTAGTPSEGVKEVRSFQTVTYKNIYPNIDLEFLADPITGIKYNFVVHKGGRPGDIRLVISGPEIGLTDNGSLILKTSTGNVEEAIPAGYFIRNGIRTDFMPKFSQLDDNEFGIMTHGVPDDFTELVIDPVPIRVWATYYGGIDTEFGYGCAVDGIGNIYISGDTYSTSSIATTGAYQTTLQGWNDSFLAKFASSGERIWGTYFGGPDWEYNFNCTIDKAGNTYVAGSTESTSNISTPGCHQSVFGGSVDCYLVKFSPGGQRIWGTYYGGTNDEQLGFVKSDDSCNLYLTGMSHSNTNISTPGSFKPTTSGGDESFLVKFDSSGQRLWGTYYGGPMGDRANDCSISKNGYVYIAGMTASASGISTPGSFQPNWIGGLGGLDGFLACFNPAGQRLWGTYYGGNGYDLCVSVAADTIGNAYISGFTSSSNVISSAGSYQSIYAGNTDVFLARFSPDGTRRWGTYYGGTDHDSTNVSGLIAVDDSSHVYLTGFTNSTTGIATPGAYQTAFAGYYDAFLVKFDSAGQRIWGTYYGGSGNESNGSVAVNTNSVQYLTGSTSSIAGISTMGSHQRDIGGGYDAFLVKFQNCAGADPAQPITGPADVCQSTSGIQFTVPVINLATGYQWSLPPGFSITGGGNTNSITLTVAPNAASGQVFVNGINSCSIGIAATLTVTVHSRPVPELAGGVETCSGEITLYTTDAGKSLYQWSVSPGGTIVSGGSPADLTAGVLWNNPGSQWISVNYTDTNGCPALLPALKNVNVSAAYMVGVFISASAIDICAGSSVTFTATPVNGGNTPIYQWKVNAVNAINANNAVFTYVPLNGDVVTCLITSTFTVCTTNNPATSSPITMTVNQILPVGVTVVASSNPFCLGNTVTFTAIPVNGGLTPFYQWQVNGNNAGTNSPVFSFTPANGDMVNCILATTEPCSTGSPASGIPITMIANITLPAGVSIVASANPFCPGSAVTFTATTVNGGTAPIYQWKVNAVNAINANNAVFSYVPANGDTVTCQMTSNLSCVTGNPASSAKIIMIGSLAPNVVFSACFDTITTVNAKSFKLKGGLPLGGNYSGPGVNSSTGYFTPSIAGTGVKTINYSYINVYDCSANKSKSILVQPFPSFTCGGNLVDTRDNKVYPTVQIGSQCWMAANLDFGLAISDFTPQTDNCVPEKYTRPASRVPRPAFYQWDELMQYQTAEGSQGICPPGWHVPSESDWTILFNYYQGNSRAGRPLQDTIINGFRAIRSGVFYLQNSMSYLGFSTLFWSSTTSGQQRALAHGMNDWNYSVSLYPAFKANAFPARCLKD